MANTTPSPTMLTIKDVARLLGCSTRHVIRLAASGDIPRPVRLGRCTRWYQPKIIDYLRERSDLANANT